MIRPSLVVVAETVLHDRTSNALSFVNVIEQVRPPGYPLILPRLAVASILERDAEDAPNAVARIQVRLDNETLLEQSLDVDFRNEKVTRVVLQFGGFIIPRPGIIRFVVNVEGQSVQSYPIVAFTPQQQQAVQVEPQAPQA